MYEKKKKQFSPRVPVQLSNAQSIQSISFSNYVTLKMILLMNSNIEFNWTGQSILWIQSISVMEVCNVVILRQDRAGAGRAVSVSVCVHPSVSDSHLVPAAATRALCSNKTACQLSRRRSLVIPMPLSSELLCLADCVFIVYYSSASAKQITSESRERLR